MNNSDMTEAEFLRLAEVTLAAVEAAVDAADADIEAVRADNVLTLELPDGSKVVINSQAPMRQIWVAAKSGGLHFERRDNAWHDTRDGSELFAALSQIVSRAGRPIALRADQKI